MVTYVASAQIRNNCSENNTAALDERRRAFIKLQQRLGVAASLSTTASGGTKIFTTATLAAFVLALAWVALSLSLDTTTLTGRFLLAAAEILLAGLSLS
jgi:hypothetical protein